MKRDDLINEVILYSNALSNLGVDTYQLLGTERSEKIGLMLERVEEGERLAENMIKVFEEKLLNAADELIETL